MTRSEPEIFTDDPLRIEITDGQEAVEVKWFGKSVQREPGKFISPILSDVIKKNSRDAKRIVLDFRELDYMNSSTMTPIIKVLDRVRKGSTRLTLIYDKSAKWQDLNFSALKLFETEDRRVEIRGL